MEYASEHGEGMAYRTLSTRQLREIHSASCQILEEIGVLVHHDEAADLLKKAGAYADPCGRIHISGELLKWAVGRAPSRVTLFNRLGQPAIRLEKSNVSFGAGSDTLHYLDPFTGERKLWNCADAAAAIRLVDALPNLDFVMSMGMLSDLDLRMINRAQYALMLKNSIKPQVVIAEDRPTLSDVFEMAAAVVGGPERLLSQPLFMVYCEPTSPLQMPFNSTDKLLLAAEKRIPVNFACGALAGATTPVTVGGTVAQANAEALAGLVVHQLKHPGAPFLYGYGDSPLDMHTMGARYAVPHTILLQGAVCDLARFYQLPSWGYAGCSSSKVFDEQAVMEGTMFTLMGALQGCNLMHDVFYIESGRTGSLEVLVLSDEVISRVKNILAGIDTGEESLAVEAVRRVGPGGNFLGDPHTARHFRENWKESISDFQNYDAWVAGGSKTMGDRIRDRLREIDERYQPVPLPVEAGPVIDNILQRAEEQLVIR